MKVIFLDFDGVITIPPRWKLNSDKIKWIKKIVKETKAKIVVSSSWRHGINRNLDYEIEIAPQNEKIINWLRNNIYDITPSCGSIRGEEIQKWLNNHPEVDNYVILDDDGDMLDSQLFHFVQTNYENGITEAEYLYCVKILNNQYIYNLLGLNFTIRTEHVKKCQNLPNKSDELSVYNDLKEDNNEKQ